MDKQDEERLQINRLDDIKYFAQQSCGIKPSRIYVEHIDACGKEKEQGKPMEVIYGYMAKIKFSITDANIILEGIEDETLKPERKDVVFLIAALSWIQESYELIERCLKPELKQEYTEGFEQSKKYIKAIRSFLVAHPMNTNRHEKLGLDGDLNCADIRPERNHECLKELLSIGCFSLNGMKLLTRQEIRQTISEEKVFYVKIYSQKDDKEKSDRYIIFYYRDMCMAANAYIQQIHTIDKAIGRAAKKRQI